MTRLSGVRRDICVLVFFSPSIFVFFFFTYWPLGHFRDINSRLSYQTDILVGCFFSPGLALFVAREATWWMKKFDQI